MRDERVSRRGFLVEAGTVTAGAAVFRTDVGLAAHAPPRLRIGPIHRVGFEGRKYIEPWIAANPRDGANLVVVGSRYLGQVATPSTFHLEPDAWFTTDGGTTWSAGDIAGTTDLRAETAYFSDAFATYAPDGTAFLVYLGSPAGNRSDLWIWRSSDGGRHWLGPTHLVGAFDYPRLAADLHQGRPRLFVAVAADGDRPILGRKRMTGYGCAILRSDDGARTFSFASFLAPTTLQHDPIDSPIILPNGRLLVGFADYAAAPSDDQPREHITHGRIYTALSPDGGSTFSAPAPIRDVLTHDGFVVLAADQSSGPRRGRVYALSHNRKATPHGPRLQTSDDGTLWTPPTAVPNLRAAPIPHAAAAVSSQGVLGLAWIEAKPGDPVEPDNKAWASREHAWQLYLSASADGGATFTAPIPVLKTPSRTDPRIPRWPHGGDYISLATAPDGSFHLLWVDTRDGRREIQTTRIDVEQ